MTGKTILLDAAAPMLEPRWLGRRMPEVAAGGIDALLATVGAIEDFRTTMEVVGKWLAIDRARSHKIRLARSVADIRAAKAAGDTAIIIHFQGADPIEDELDFIDIFHAVGLRVMQVTYNLRNRLGDGCFEPTDAGLSKFGRKAIARMEELGVVVDLAHAGERTALETAAAATRPFVVTHANARALFDVPRNASDAVIRAVAAAGGVGRRLRGAVLPGARPPPDARHADRPRRLHRRPGGCFACRPRLRLRRRGRGGLRLFRL